MDVAIAGTISRSTIDDVIGRYALYMMYARECVQPSVTSHGATFHELIFSTFLLITCSYNDLFLLIKVIVDSVVFSYIEHQLAMLIF